MMNIAACAFCGSVNLIKDVHVFDTYIEYTCMNCNSVNRFQKHDSRKTCPECGTFLENGKCQYCKFSIII